MVASSPEPSSEQSLWLRLHRTARTDVLSPDLVIFLSKSHWNPLDLRFSELNFTLSELKLQPLDATEFKISFSHPLPLSFDRVEFETKLLNVLFLLIRN
ncbi:hypothetical protein COLO4_34352 [Corchorus olitorius]|uniref:Uncharacterized protein n=1 Tax=Corchorus olitorius TaxID=93759 RepID=A0A1R3GLC6_9ROSI|nr:hypothetical protein COLO4_34352 [Corchorus olitorius]